MRLTHKKEDWYWKDEEFWLSAENPSLEKADEIYYKLAEFEDFMEEQGFESLEELKINTEYLKDKIKTDKFNYEQLHKFKNHLQEENQALKDRWEKLKDYVKEERKKNKDLACTAWYNADEEFLAKMKELEKG